MKNGKALPSTHALIIEPFKTIWNNDDSEGKGDAINKFTFIELMCSKKKSNPFTGYSQGQRYSKVVENVYGETDYRPTNDPLVAKGMEIYEEFLHNASPSLTYLEAALIAAENLKNTLETIDFSERTNGGAAVYKPADITRALKETPDVVKTLEQLREKVQSELLEEAKTRGSREIGAFER